ncbi:FmdB family zinc ribbon protein [Chloroflexota bacterium]
MPIYEYECKKCGERFELFRSIKDSDNDTRCPKCGKEFPERLFSGFGTTFSSGAGYTPIPHGGSS